MPTASYHRSGIILLQTAAAPPPSLNPSPPYWELTFACPRQEVIYDTDRYGEITDPGIEADLPADARTMRGRGRFRST